MPILFGSDLELPRDPQEALHAVTKQYVDAGLSGKAASSHTQAYTTITGLGTAATCNTGTSSGNIPLLDSGGKLNASVLPTLAISSVNGKTGVVVLVASDVGAIPTTEKGAINGVAPLDGSKLVPIAQLPTQSTVSSSTTQVPTGAAVYAHTSSGSVHNATATPTASTIVMWDANKRIKAAAPSASDDVTIKSYVDGLTTGKSYKTTVSGTGSATTFTVTHNLASNDVVVDVFKSISGKLVKIFVPWDVTSTNAIILNFAVAPLSTDSFTVKVAL